MWRRKQMHNRLWNRTDLAQLAAAIEAFETALPGWWWSLGACSASLDVSCGPDRQGPDAWMLRHPLLIDGLAFDFASTGDYDLAFALEDVTKHAVEVRERVLADKAGSAVAMFRWIVEQIARQASIAAQDAVEAVRERREAIHRAALCALRDGGMPVFAIAEICRVSRSTVYAWLKGGDLRHAGCRLPALAEGLYCDLNLGLLWKVRRRPLQAGDTLLDRLTADRIDPVSIRAACEELRAGVERDVRRAAERALRFPRGEGRIPNAAVDDAVVADMGDGAA